jgi:hypothetical protein
MAVTGSTSTVLAVLAIIGTSVGCTLRQAAGKTVCSQPEADPALNVVACGGPLGCDGVTILAKINADGSVAKVDIRGTSSREWKRCIVEELRHRSFSPGRTCDGRATAAEWRQELTPICDPGPPPPLPEEKSMTSELANNELQRTRPAQATEPRR